MESGECSGEADIDIVYTKLKEAYNHIRPLEEHYNFPFFFSPLLNDVDIEAKPFVFLLGQYSVGKTSIINHLLGTPNGYPGCNVGPEPTTDRFIAIMHGEEERVLPGNMISASADKPFMGLQKFGNNFLGKFQCAEMPSEILKNVTIVDSPGVLSGEQQRIGRNYHMTEVCQWFAERSDIILLIFDAHKLDISDELKDIIEHLRGHADKIRIVLNKSDQVSGKQLMRVYGALMWSLSKVFKSPEVCRVYISSFWDKPYSKRGWTAADLFDSEKHDLYTDIRDIPRYAAIRRVNELIKRARLSRAHALLCGTLRGMMPGIWGRDHKQRELISNLDVIYDAVSVEHGLSLGDLPDPECYRRKLQSWVTAGKSLASLPALDKPKFQRVAYFLDHLIPELLQPLTLSWSACQHTTASEALRHTPPHDAQALVGLLESSLHLQGGAYELPEEGAAEAFAGASVDDLPLIPGQYVRVLLQDSSGWIKGRCESSGKEGWFPHNYVVDP